MLNMAINDMDTDMQGVYHYTFRISKMIIDSIAC